jgi:hypothetical protein
MFKGFAVAALVIAAAVPAVAAKSDARVKLSLLPLPASSLGAPARGLAVAHDSRVVSNAAVVPA